LLRKNCILIFSLIKMGYKKNDQSELKFKINITLFVIEEQILGA